MVEMVVAVPPLGVIAKLLTPRVSPFGRGCEAHDVVVEGGDVIEKSAA